MSRERLDQELVRRRMLVSRSGARSAIREGHVTIDGSPVTRPSHRVGPDMIIAVAAEAGRYVGRGGRKLDGALCHFDINVSDRSCIDVGASTGGFTDVLLQAGARSVVAVDVGHGQLHTRLRADPRVSVREGINIRHTDASGLGAPFDVVVGDLSFISLRLVAGALAELGGDSADWVLLVKPQFEVGAAGIGKGGVVRSGRARGDAVVAVAAAFVEEGLAPIGVMSSPIVGGSGNREALLWLRRSGAPVAAAELAGVLADV